MTPVIGKGFLTHSLTNLINKVLIIKIGTMLGMSHKGDLKQGTDFKSKAWRNKKGKMGELRHQSVNLLLLEEDTGQRWCPRAQAHTHCSCWSLHPLPNLQLLLQQPGPLEPTWAGKEPILPNRPLLPLSEQTHPAIPVAKSGRDQWLLSSRHTPVSPTAWI